jgi:hypothetical protein
VLEVNLPSRLFSLLLVDTSKAFLIHTGKRSKKEIEMKLMLWTGRIKCNVAKLPMDCRKRRNYKGNVQYNTN